MSDTIQPATAEDMMYLAQARLFEAEAAKHEEERRRAAAEARLAAAAADQAEITLERDRYRRRLELAADEHHMFYPFTGSVSDTSVNQCIDVLTTWMRTRPEEPVEIQFNSPGGSIVAGFALWDYIQTLRSRGHYVTTSTVGFAASMAGILLQAGDERVMGRESYLMIHEASFGAAGKMGDIEDTVEWVKMVQERILRIFAARSTMTVEEIRSRWERKDWWLDSDTALELGFIDKIR